MPSVWYEGGNEGGNDGGNEGDSAMATNASIARLDRPPQWAGAPKPN